MTGIATGFGARPALVAKVTDTTEVGFGMATGGDDPVSTNQTLGGGGSTKDVRLDLAYATWTGLEGYGYYRRQILQPLLQGEQEPTHLGWRLQALKAPRYAGRTTCSSANASYSFIESDSKEDDDGLWGVQVGSEFAPLDSFKVIASASYIDVPAKGRTAIYDDDFFGNSSVEKDGEEVYEFDYKMMNASLDVVFNVFNLPLSVYGEYVKNDDADDFDTGYLAGIKLGKAKKRGSWQLLYQYEDLEADAVLGLLTDSDFAGGGTDGKGHKFSAKYAIDNHWTVGATYFDNKTDVDLGEDLDYERLQIDTVFKY